MSSLVHAKCVSSAIASSPSVDEPVAHQVLDGLHVVAGDRLLLGEPVDLGLAEVAVQGAQARPCRSSRQRRGAEQRPVGEGDEPLDLDLDAGAVEPRLGEVVGERRDGGAVAAVERAEGLRGKRGHGLRRRSATCGWRQIAGRIAGSSCRKSDRLALSIIPSTSSNIPGPA